MNNQRRNRVVIFGVAGALLAGAAFAWSARRANDAPSPQLMIKPKVHKPIRRYQVAPPKVEMMVLKPQSGCGAAISAVSTTRV